MQKQNSTISKKLARITKEAEILSLMEESHKNKEWIKRQIKKKSLGWRMILNTKVIRGTYLVMENQARKWER